MTQTILTVDDSRTMRDMLRMALAEAGFNVMQAVDGVHGLEVLQTAMPDVIVTDINMPKMDGFGLIEAVRKDGRYRNVPILVLTTESDAAKEDAGEGSRRDRLDRQALRTGQTHRRHPARCSLSPRVE